MWILDFYYFLMYKALERDSCLGHSNSTCCFFVNTSLGM